MALHARQKPHLALWHRREAEVPVGDEGVLHCVHSETIEGGLGAHILLEAFDHSAIESGPNRGPSASSWSHDAVFVLGSAASVPRSLCRPCPLPRAPPVGVPAPYPPFQTSRDACEMGTSGRGSSLPPGTRHPHSIFRVCLRICLCPGLLVSLPSEAGAAPGLALFPAPLPPPPWLPARTPEDVVVGIDVQTLAGTIQNASVPHHCTANAVWKRLPGGGKQLGALGVIQEAQGGVDGCGCQTRWGAQRRDVMLEPPQEGSWHPICQRSDTRAQRVEGGGAGRAKCQWDRGLNWAGAGERIWLYP